jgi:hypothetical protein
MVSIVELTIKFGPALEVDPWGSCLWILGTEFDPDWEAELDDLGYSCHDDILDGFPGTFVQLKKSVASGKVVYVPPKPVDPAPAAAARVYWSPEEDAFLMELWKSDLTIDQISLSVAAKFPIRVGKAVKSRLDRLKIADKIQSRKHSGNEVKKMEKKNQVANKGSGCQKGPDWTQAQTDLLTASWEQLKALPKEKRAQLLAKMPEFAGRSANSILQKAYKLQQKTSKEAERSPEAPKVDDCSKNAPGTLDKRLDSVKVEPADPDDNEVFMENEKPKWNGEFGEKCNLEHDCIDCDIVECIGRKSEGLQKSKVDDADVLVNLVKEITVLREGYTSLIQAYVELRLKIECIWKDTEKTLGSFATEMPSNEDLAAVRKDLSIHKHVVSGEAMIPLEAS